MTRFFLFFALTFVFLFPNTGCFGKKKAAKKDYGKPTWLAVDESKFVPLSEDATDLENGTITVYDPKGWERQPRGYAKPRKGFKSVIVFKKDAATILMTKSQDAKGLPELNEENIEEFAEGAQTKFKSPVKMVKLGDKVGVYFSRKVADGQRLSKFYHSWIVATTIHGGLFTYEIMTDKEKIDESLKNALFALIAKTQFANMDSGESNSVDSNLPKPDTEEKIGEKKPEQVATTTPPEPSVKEEKSESVPEKTVAATEELKPEVKPEVKPEPKPVEIAEIKPAVKKTEKNDVKESPQKPAKKSVQKGNTKDILNELDALLN